MQLCVQCVCVCVWNKEVWIDMTLYMLRMCLCWKAIPRLHASISGGEEQSVDNETTYHLHMYAYMYMYIYMCVCIYIYIYIHMLYMSILNMHMHMHVNMHIRVHGTRIETVFVWIKLY